jgi:phage terminase small subunit
MPISPKQRRFVQEYLIDLNAKQAYIRAGYKARDNAAEVNACRLLRNAQVKAAIKEAQDERARQAGVDAHKVVVELAAIAHQRWARMTQDGPVLLRPEEMSPGIDKCLAWMKVKRVNAGRAGDCEILEFRMHSKTEALRDLAKHLGLLKETVSLEGSDEMPLSFKQIVDVEPPRTDSDGRNNGDG